MSSNTDTGVKSTLHMSFVEIVLQKNLTASADDDLVGFPFNLSKTAKSLNHSRCILSSTGHMSVHVPIKLGRDSTSLPYCFLLIL